jgi:hypothetical protein
MRTELKQTAITRGLKTNRNYSLSQTSSVMYTICLHLKMKCRVQIRSMTNFTPITVPIKVDRRHRIRPVEKNLPVPLKKDCHPPALISGSSSSPSQLIRTPVCFPPIESSSIGSSGDGPLLSSSESSSSESTLPLRHFPVCGRSPTKYTRLPRTSETRAVHSSSARENAIRS